jgi:sulfhydrogenase subunit alpha
MKKVIAEHLERVEGHGGIEIIVEGAKVVEAKFNVNEGPRLIEQLVVGKSMGEVLNIVPRVCAICSVSHRYAAIRALESILSIEPAKNVSMLRELMHLGEIIESNSLHVFMLSLPDIYGFSSAINMHEKYPKTVSTGLKLKSFGNHLMKVITGRAIHGENPIINGFGKYPSTKEMFLMRKKAEELLSDAIEEAVQICDINYFEFPEIDTIFAALNTENDEYGFVGNEILISDGQKISIQDYKDFAAECVVPHSYAKHSLYKNKPYTVGALARINLLGERLKGHAQELYRKFYNIKWRYNPFYNIPAQTIEIIYALERLMSVIDNMVGYQESSDNKEINFSKANGSAAGAVEAPRGILFHYYEVNGGTITGADIVTPTAQNAADIERCCYSYAQFLLDNNLSNDLELGLRKLVRAFDPCISCSVH